MNLTFLIEDRAAAHLVAAPWPLMKSFALFFSTFVLLLLPACSPVTSHYSQVNFHLAVEDFDYADQLILDNKKVYGKRSILLYYFDRAMTLHLAERYSKSNEFLEKAEKLISKLYRKSILSEAGALLTNDNMLPYEGEDFEKVSINILSALNYAFLGDWDEALVEVRKVDHKLNLINDRYEKKNVYKEDAYARYLSGILYEAKGELNDAFIAYRKAYETYRDYYDDYGTPLPSMLPKHLLRITEALGLSEEHKEYRKKFPTVKWTDQKEFRNLGELVFLSYDGHSPIKEESTITIPITDKSRSTYIVRIAIPRFVPQSSNLSYAKLHVTGVNKEVLSRKMFLMEDISAIAIKNLNDRIGRITAKAIARATAKYIAAEEIKKKNNDNEVARVLVDILTSAYSIATEVADKRSWRTLPGQVRLSRLSLSPGSYEINAEYYGHDRRLIFRKTYSVIIRAGEIKFLKNRFMGY